ncbi:MAG: hypothetical protein MHM6MM_000205 [Cercozoa sp. M6MM]
MDQGYLPLTCGAETSVHTAECFDNDALLFEIVRFLGVEEMRALSLTCRRFHNEIACNDSVVHLLPTPTVLPSMWSQWKPLAATDASVLEEQVAELGDRKWRSLAVFRHIRRSQTRSSEQPRARVPEIESCHLMAPTKSVKEFTRDGVYVRLPRDQRRFPQVITQSQAPSNALSRLVKLPRGVVWQFRCPLLASRAEYFRSVESLQKDAVDVEEYMHSEDFDDVDPDSYMSEELQLRRRAFERALSENTVDYCSVCSRRVYYVTREQELRQRAAQGDCVFFDDSASWLRGEHRENRRPQYYGGGACVIN